MAAKEYITTAEVAQRLKLSVSTVTRLARVGVIPAIKMGKLWRFSEQDTQIRLYKQKQQQQQGRSFKESYLQKNGWSGFLKLSAEIGYIESK